MKMRLFPIVISIMIMTMTVRVGDMLVTLVSQDVWAVKNADAFAQDTKKDAEKTPPAAAEKADEKTEKPETTETAQGLDDEKDPFLPEYNEEEINVLQSLAKRREQIEQRERDMEQREKLLQAAEKKVDEKVVELNKLKQEIESLLDKQQAIQESRVNQLVKIYENMKPKDAAIIFNDMEFDVLLGLIDAMSERKVAPILAAMDPVRAREVSAKLADQKALPKKTAQ